MRLLTLSSEISFVAAATIALSAAMFGCSKDAQPAKTPASEATSPAPQTQYPKLPAEKPASPTTSAVRIAADIAKACGISEPDSYFAFDSKNLRPEDTAMLDQVAVCFTTGPLKERSMKVVGHADPRGTEEYNITLGQSRSDSVGNYLESKGVPKGRVQTSSRGELDAVGTGEPSWAKDRRVDIMLAQ